MANPAILDPVGRRGFLGASEIAAALALLPDTDTYAKPIDIWLEKTGAERVSREHPGQAEAGQRIEPVVRDWYADLMRCELSQPGTLRHPHHEWVGCTPDSLVMVSGQPVRNVQIKCVGARMVYDWGGQSSITDTGELVINPPDGTPNYYRCQVAWEMFVLRELYGIEQTHLVALLGGTDLRIYDVPHDPELLAALFEAARKFWFDYVIPDRPPPPDGSAAFRAFLLSRYPIAERPFLDTMTAEAAELARKYLRARDIERRAKSAKDLASNQLRELIGDRAGFLGQGLKILLKNGTRALDVKEIEERL